MNNDLFIHKDKYKDYWELQSLLYPSAVTDKKPKKITIKLDRPLNKLKGFFDEPPLDLLNEKAR